MKRGLHTVVLLTVFVMALSVISCAGTADNELFAHQSPDFTLTVPKWMNQKVSQDPNSILRRRSSPESPTFLDIAIKDLRTGATFKDVTPAFTKSLENLWKGANFNILYEREINLKDGTPAYEFELKWKSGMWPLRSYAVVVFKDEKVILVVITSLLWVGDSLKQYPLSLVMK